MKNFLNMTVKYSNFKVVKKLIISPNSLRNSTPSRVNVFLKVANDSKHSLCHSWSDPVTHRCWAFNVILHFTEFFVLLHKKHNRHKIPHLEGTSSLILVMQYTDLLFSFTPTVIVSVIFGTEHYLQQQITRWHILVWDWWVQWNILPKIKTEPRIKSKTRANVWLWCIR